VGTSCTNSLREQFQEVGANLSDFVQQFNDWKSSSEYGSYLFGKDGAYGPPVPSASPGRLKHVHLVPVLDEGALAAWDRDWERRTRKVSDRALVYAEDLSGNFLLLFIFNEPEAHEIARMKTPENKLLMKQLVAVAAEWAFSGKVLA
jgi:Toxin YafO, type II toxin-antitoxin system